MVKQAKAMWTVSDLADATGLSRGTTLRLLKQHGLDGYRVGRKVLVPSCALKSAMAPVWDSMETEL